MSPFPQIGPRMTLQLVKVEEGLAQGNVLYHGFGECRGTPGRCLTGAPSGASHPLSRCVPSAQDGERGAGDAGAEGGEAAAQGGAAAQAGGGRGAQAAAARGAEVRDPVTGGPAASRQLPTPRWCRREKSLAGMRRKRQQDGDSDAEDPGAPEAAKRSESDDDDDDDAEYYRQEVGEEPDKGEPGGAGIVPSLRRRWLMTPKP